LCPGEGGEIKLAKTDIKIMENVVNENCMEGGRASKTLTGERF
jgi:hypothetical protein